MGYNLKTLLRDFLSNPIPQFYNPTADAFQPLTGADLGGGRYASDGLIWGKTAGGLYLPVQVMADGSISTQLSGRNVQEILGHNAVAITDTVVHNTAILDLSVISGKKTIFVQNTLNQAITIVIWVTVPSGGVINSNGIIVPANEPKLITAADMPLLAEPLYSALIQGRCTIAPTSGSLTTYMEGVQA